MTLQDVTPMINVPDVRATVAWYEAIGFTVLGSHDDPDDGMTFALLAYGNSQIMLSAGGRASAEHRRDVDLYIRTADVDGLHLRLKDRVEVCVALNDAFYGSREFIVRDPNGFWITFGQPIASTDAC